MRDPIRKSHYWIEKRARRGFQGYPIATVAYYGPDNRRATKVAVGIVTEKDEVTALKRWYSEEADVRRDPSITGEIVEFIERHRPKSIVVTDGIIGCPHEEGIDYPEGENCAQCPFWANRDRWNGERIH